MDPIAGINVKKDTTLALLLAAQGRGWELFYMEMRDIYLDGNAPRARARRLTVADDASEWHQFHGQIDLALADLDVVLMRKDPPFDMEYIYMTYMLEHAAAAGALVVNHPTGLRDANEKAFIAHFPQCIAPTLISREAGRLHEFTERHGRVALKPLDGMGGASVFIVNSNDANRNVIVETLTGKGQRFIMAQQYLAAIKHGDKRILLIDGKPVERALARVPKAGDARGNLAAGGIGKGVELSERDRWICEQVGPTLRERGLLFAGLDIIGDYLTEINVTSPTCVRELDNIYGLNIPDQVMDRIAEKRELKS